MSKIKFSFLSFLSALLFTATAYATECTTDADCATGETCVVVASAECPPCAEGSACDSCATEVLACVPADAPTDCGAATTGSGSGAAEGSAAGCGSGDPVGSGSGEVTPVAGSGSGETVDVDGSGSGVAATADKSKDESGCSTVPATAGILGFFAMIGTLLYLRRRV
jgi:hypothetical protein